MSVVFEEPDGVLLNVIGQRGGVCRACTEFIDKEETARSKCLYSDTNAAWAAQGSLLGRGHGNVIVEFYICNGKLRNFVIPISIGGEVLGNVFSGQFLVQTLKREDPNFQNIIDEMLKLGVTRNFALSYARMPEESEILEIARQNDIQPSDWPAFGLAYKEMRARAKPLSYFIDAVYLLNEVAQTISSFGNAYYYSSLFTRLTRIVPHELKLFSASHLEQINCLVQKIKAQPLVDFTNEIRQTNELIHNLLLAIEEHESKYIDALILPYARRLFSASSTIVECQKMLLIAKTSYMASKVRTRLNKSLRDKALNPNIYSDEDKALLDKCDSEAKSVEDILAQETTTILKHFDMKNLQQTNEKIKDIKRRLEEREITYEAEEPGLDDIEAMLELLTHPSFGLQAIRRRICEDRVLKELPEPFADLRQALRLRYDTVYMNWGGISPSYDFVVNEREVWTSDLDQHGPVSTFSEERLETLDAARNVLARARETVSRLIRCKPEEIILTANTTHGVSLALSSIDFSPKGSKETDRILLTNLEHDTVFYCIKQIEDRFNTEHGTINLSSGSSSRSIAEEITRKSSDGKTKVVILSHVTYNTGQTLDIAGIITEVREILGKKSPLFLIDGAQAVGHIPVNVSSYSCDFYAADAHKWLIGPKGSGFLFVRESFLEERKEHFPFYENYMVAERFRPVNPNTKMMYEPATMNVEIYVGMTSAIEAFLEAHRKGQVFERIKELSEEFREQAETELKQYDVQMIGRTSRSGLVTVAFSNQDKYEFYDEIRRNLDQEFHIVARAIFNPPSLRFCISYLNSKWEIKFAIKALQKILEAIPSFASRLAQAKQVQDVLVLQKRRTAMTIESAFEHAKEIVWSRQKETERKFSDFSSVQRSRKIADEIIAKLNLRTRDYSEQAKRALSVAQLQELERRAAEEIDKILFR